jgi:hypothetical protein
MFKLGDPVLRNLHLDFSIFLKALLALLINVNSYRFATSLPIHLLRSVNLTPRLRTCVGQPHRFLVKPFRVPVSSQQCDKDVISGNLPGGWT